MLFAAKNKTDEEHLEEKDCLRCQWDIEVNFRTSF